MEHLKAQRGRFTMTTSVPGQDGLKIDLKAAGSKQGVDVAPLQSLSGGGDPTQFLTYLPRPANIDYKRFGVPVDVQPPPADETVDYSDVAAGG